MERSKDHNYEADKATEELARILYFKEWHLDPDPDGEPLKWDDLPDFDRQFYCSVVKALLGHVSLIKSALR
jgi:hypothetical protein